MNDTTHSNLRIWQQNVNKSLLSQLHLLNTARPNDWDLIILQEPWMGSLGTRNSHHWRVLYPKSFYSDNTKSPRSIILINTNIPTNSYEQIHFNSPDVTGTKITQGSSKILVINVYNDCKNNDSIDAVSTFLTHQFPNDHIPDDVHIIFAGDFNRHHPSWEEERNAHLTTSERLLHPLTDIISRYDFRMALPPYRPTLRALSSGNWTRPDNVWCTSHSLDLFVSCDTSPGLQGPNTDHLPILSKLDIPIARSPPRSFRNFRATDWDDFTSHLTDILAPLPSPKRILSHTQFRTALDVLNAAISNTIEKHVPISKPLPHTKRWWNQDLTTARKKKNRLANDAYKWRGLPDHTAHELHRDASREYAKLIETTKKEHWENWLLNASERDVWTANKYATDPPTDSGKPRMPALITTDQNGNDRHTSTNDEKSEALAKSFFPPPPSSPAIPAVCYPQPAKIFKFFSRAHIRNTADKLSAFKAPGPDGIPNVVLKKCIDVISDRLYFIFRAIFEIDVYPDEWKESITVVLRKPGKPSYELPKAYRPIALLNTLGKLFSTLVADDLSHYCETRNVLPPHQFGGRPSHCTSDSMLLLTQSIKDAWRSKKVASVLFLDVQGAFPNVVKKVLLHNMRLRGVPSEYIRVTELMLTGRKTRLSFDDFLSAFIPIDNGNNQGCPLSMLFYAFYNAGLLEISHPDCKDEKQFGFVDDVALLAVGSDFTETYQKLSDMMNHPHGAFDWSISHFSQFELSKLAIMNFSPKSSHTDSLTLQHPLSPSPTTIKPTQSYKFLGVLFDPKLKWNTQTDRAARSAEAWINLVKRLARTSSGISARGMRQLYTAVAVPKITYAADVWFTLPHYSSPTAKNRTGSVKFIKRITSAQRSMTIAMLGAMRSTAGDVLNAHASLLPPHLLFLKNLTRSATRLATLPDDHPLSRPSRRAIKNPVKRHRSPLHTLFATTNLTPDNYEKILTSRRRRNYHPRAKVTIEDDRIKAVTNAMNTRGTIIYTDGSGFEKGIGAAAILMQNGTTFDTIRYYLGPDNQHTVYEAEATAVILALHIACNLKKKLRKLTIGLDNQAVLLGLLNQRPKPGHYLLDKIHDLLEDYQVSQLRLRNREVKGYRKGTGRTRLDDGSTGWKDWRLKMTSEVEFIWTPGHEGIIGNELVDTEAKAAAQGDSSPTSELPPLLRKKPLPISISSTRQVLKNNLTTRWKGEWQLSPRYERMLAIDNSLPSNDYLSIIGQLRRNQASLLTQFRTGHIPLNVTLFRIKKAASPFCPHCGHGTPESIFHFLLICPHHASARRPLLAVLGRHAMSIPFLLGTKTGIPYFLRYVADTKRLKTTFGEIRPDDDSVITEKHEPKDVLFQYV